MYECAVQASIAANTWVVSGTPQTKSMFSLLQPFSLGIKVTFELFFSLVHWPLGLHKVRCGPVLFRYPAIVKFKLATSIMNIFLMIIAI